MEYSKIISITGLPGLYEMVNSKNDGALVRSLEDKTTRFVSSRVHHFSHLESIEVFTIRENVNLADVFQAMRTSEENLPGEKDSAQIKNYFEKVFPDMDFERVYTSDMRKMVKWFDVLQKNNIEIQLSEEEPAEEEIKNEMAEGSVSAEELNPATNSTDKNDTPAAVSSTEEIPSQEKMKE